MKRNNLILKFLFPYDVTASNVTRSSFGGSMQVGKLIFLFGILATTACASNEVRLSERVKFLEEKLRSFEQGNEPRSQNQTPKVARNLDLREMIRTCEQSEDCFQNELCSGQVCVPDVDAMIQCVDGAGMQGVKYDN